MGRGYSSLLTFNSPAAIAGDCMAPEIPNGGLVIVDRTARPIAGELVAIYRTRETTPHGAPQAILRRLVMTPPPWVTFPDREYDDVGTLASAILVEQDCPPRLMVISGRDVLGLHRVVGFASAEEERDVPPLAMARA